MTIVGKKKENIAFSKLVQSWKLSRLVNNHLVEIQTILKMTDKEKLQMNWKLKNLNQKKKKKNKEEEIQELMN